MFALRSGLEYLELTTREVVLDCYSNGGAQAIGDELQRQGFGDLPLPPFQNGAAQGAPNVSRVLLSLPPSRIDVEDVVAGASRDRRRGYRADPHLGIHGAVGQLLGHCIEAGDPRMRV